MKSRLPIVVTPLRFEQRVLTRAAPPLDLHCCGPGPAAITKWAVAGGRTSRPVVLAGLAGGLSERTTPGSAFAVDRVIDGQGREWPVPLAAQLGARTPPVTVISTVKTVTSAAAKRALAGTCGADLVDLESVAFAHAATKLGWTWGIVRGVSDGPDDDLPPGAAGWIDDRGRTRTWRVAADILRSPSMTPRLLALRRHGVAGMRAAAARVAGLAGPA